MSLYFRILIVLLTIVYIISPFDFLPDFVPFAGRFDDLFLFLMVIYYLMKGKLPPFLFRRGPTTGFSGNYSRQSTRKESREENEETRSQSESEKAGARRYRTTAPDPYEILGLEPGASREAIRAAYRRKAHQYHPDKVSHLGAEFQELAKKKFVDIQNAYDQLMS